MQPSDFLYTTKQIRQLEQLAIKHGITGDIMMQRAADASMQIIMDRYPNLSSMVVFCGAGNNGGDGYVIARLAHEKGIKVQVRFIGKSKNEASRARKACEQSGVTIKSFDAQEALNAEIFVDALLGIGLTGKVKKNYVQAINYLNQSVPEIVAIDVPSGIDADTGAVLGNAAMANCTITFIGIKQGMLTNDAPDHCGDITCDDLDLDTKLFEKTQHAAEIITLEDYEDWLIPRLLSSNKGDFGHVLVIGGDYGMSGAPHMAGCGALRAGAGMVTIATQAEHAATLNIAQPELMCKSIKSAKDLIPLIKKASVIAIGPGLGQSVWGKTLLNTTLKHASVPLVVDADALNLLAKNPCSRKNWILTPHPGEAGRLLNLETAEIQKNRFKAIEKLHKKYGGVCVLKGNGTLILSEAMPAKVCVNGNPGMAGGGMGDILTGIIAGLIAQDIPLNVAAELGVCLHAEAADYAAFALGERGLLATDLLPYIQKLVNILE